VKHDRSSAASAAKPLGKWLFSEWNDDTSRLIFTVEGVQGTTTHTYRFEFTASELAEMVESAIDGGCRERSAKAFGKAMAAFLRAALSEA
jgi:hypothetical protein